MVAITGFIGSKKVNSFTEFDSRLKTRRALNDRTTDRYEMIDSGDVLLSVERMAASRGLQVESIKLSATGKKSTKHVMRVRFSGTGGDGQNRYRPELVIFNSYNGEQSLRIETGIFRLICSNGLTLATDRETHATVRHIAGPRTVEFKKQLDYQIAAAIDALSKIDGRINQLTNTPVTAVQELGIITQLGLSKRVNNNLSLIRGGNAGRDHEPNLWALYNAVNEALRISSRSSMADEMKNKELLSRMEAMYENVA